MGFELVGDLCLSLSKIVSGARAVAEDPAIDGFGHHNPQLGHTGGKGTLTQCVHCDYIVIF